LRKGLEDASNLKAEKDGEATHLGGQILRAKLEEQTWKRRQLEEEVVEEVERIVGPRGNTCRG